MFKRSMVGSAVRVSPAVWSGKKQPEIQPGDLSLFVPRQKQHCGRGPFGDAPVTEACGGVVYFDNDITREELAVLAHLMGLQRFEEPRQSKDYAVFTAQSDPPGAAGYLSQVRIVSRFGLRFLFKAIAEDEFKSFPRQDITAQEALWSFIEHERGRWGTYFGDDRKYGLHGLFGGDGNYSREQLSFGFMAENTYYGIFRMWSRAWLVGK